MKIIRWVLPLGLSGAGVWWALRGVSFGEIFSALGHLRSPWALCVVPVVGGIEMGLRSERWRRLLEEPASHRGLLFKTVAGAFLMNNLLPFRAGEAARIYWTHRHTGRSVPRCTAALVVDRLCDLFTLAGLLCVLVWTGRSGVLSPAKARGALALLLGAGGTVLAVTFFAQRLESWVGGLSLPGPLQRFFSAFLEGTGPLRSPGAWGPLAGVSLGIWIGNVFLIQFTAGLFELSLSWSQAAVFLIALAMGVALPSTPGFIGTYEAAGTAALLAFGFDRSRAVPFVLVYHTLQISGSLIWGLPSLWGLGKRHAV